MHDARKSTRSPPSPTKSSFSWSRNSSSLQKLLRFPRDVPLQAQGISPFPRAAKGNLQRRAESSGPERKGPVRGQRGGEVGTPQLILAKVGEGSAKSHAGKVGCQKISGTSRAQSSSTELVATAVEPLPRPTQHQRLAQHRVLLCRALFSARSREVNGIGTS